MDRGINYKNLEKIIPSLNLKSLDLSSTEGFKYAHLVEQLLLDLVFNEFSSCKDLVI